jgi:hypothetical protein
VGQGRGGVTVRAIVARLPGRAARQIRATPAITTAIITMTMITPAAAAPVETAVRPTPGGWGSGWG